MTTSSKPLYAWAVGRIRHPKTRRLQVRLEVSQPQIRHSCSARLTEQDCVELATRLLNLAQDFREERKAVRRGKNVNSR